MISAARQYAQAGDEAGGPDTAPDPIGRADWRRLAALHCASLPGSAIAALGEPYAERFYRYLAESSTEYVVLHRDARDVIDAVCVVSLDPSGLNRRLWCRTPLLWALVRASRAGGRRALASALSPSPGAHRYESGIGASRVVDARAGGHSGVRGAGKTSPGPWTYVDCPRPGLAAGGGVSSLPGTHPRPPSQPCRRLLSRGGLRAERPLVPPGLPGLGECRVASRVPPVRWTRVRTKRGYGGFGPPPGACDVQSTPVVLGRFVAGFDTHQVSAFMERPLTTVFRGFPLARE